MPALFFILRRCRCLAVVLTLTLVPAAGHSTDNLLYNAAGQLVEKSTNGGIVPPSIVSDPASATVEIGQPFALAVVATGSALTYQWHKGPDEIPGATGASLFFPSITGSDAASYTVTVTSGGGPSVTSDPAVLSFPPNRYTGPLGGVGFEWASSGTTVWKIETDPAKTHDGISAVGTGLAFEDDSRFEGKVTVTEPTTLTYWMRLPSTSESFTGALPCEVRVLVEGRIYMTVTSVDFPNPVWREFRIHLPRAGTFDVGWQHRLNGYVLIDDMSLAPALDTDMDGLSDEWEEEYLDGLAAEPGVDDDFDLNSNWIEYHDLTDPDSGGSRLIHALIDVVGNGQIELDPEEPEDGYEPDIDLLATPVPDPGHVFVMWESGQQLFNSIPHTFPISFQSLVAKAYFDPTLPIGDGIDTSGVIWTTGGDAPWITQTHMTFDGVDAIMSGGMPETLVEGISWVEAAISGPVRLQFRSKNSSQDAWLRVNGRRVMEVPYGLGGWSENSVFLPAGSHSVRIEHRNTYGGLTVLDAMQISATVDTDMDGMADDWETLHFQTLDRDGFEDYDGDGVVDIIEFGDLSNPNSFSDRRIRIVVNTLGNGTASVIPSQSSYHPSDEVTFNAVPASGWKLLAWETDPSTVVIPTNPYTNIASSLPTSNLAVTARFAPEDDLNEALDNFDLVFENGFPGWSRETSASYDGEDSASSPNRNFTASSFATELAGPHIISFWWRLDRSETSSNSILQFSLNTDLPFSAQPNEDWSRVFVQIPPGTHTLTWAHNQSDFNPEFVSVARIDRFMNGADGDQDGIPNAWEMQEFGTLEHDGDDDNDLDGNSNQIEWADGTDPESNASAFYRLTITSDGPGGVVVSPSQPAHAAGTQVTLTAEAAFTGWSGDASGSVNPLVVTMNTNKSILATFAPVSRGADSLGLLFQTDPTKPWQIEEGNSSYFDNDAASSSTSLLQNQESWVETTFTTGGRVTFDAIRRFDFGSGHFRWLLDGVEVGRHDNIYSASQNISILIPPGTHTVRWIYRQGSDVGQNSAALLDQVVWTPLTVVPLEQALDRPGSTWTFGGAGSPTWIGLDDVTHDGVDAAETLKMGHNGSAVLETVINPSVPCVVSFWWKVSSEDFFDKLTFLNNGTPISSAPAISGEQDWQKVSFTVPAGTRTLRWTYSKDSTGIAGLDRAWIDEFSVVPLQTLSLQESLDQPSLTWTTSGGAAWTGSNLDSHDGVDAAFSAPIPDGGTSWVETQVTGPDTVTFWWKVSSELSRDYLRFLVDGVPAVAPISGQVGWTEVTYLIPAGNHTLRWSYTKDASPDTVGGGDRAWLDQVSLSPPPTDFPGWLSHFDLIGPDADAGANPTGDGINNLLKYAFNIPPHIAVGGASRQLVPGSGRGGLPSITLAGAAGNQRLRVEYLRRRNVSEITYQVEFSSTPDSGEWVGTSLGETVTLLDDDWERVVVLDTVDSSSEERRYARVRVEQNQ